MKENLFSLCLLATGSNYLLIQTLKSIQDQSYQNKEILLVCTEKYAKENSFPNFVRIVHPNSTNPASFANKAVEEAKGKYLLFFLPGESFLFSEALQYVNDSIESAPSYSLYQFGHMAQSPITPTPSTNLLLLKKGRLFAKLCSCVIAKELFWEKNLFFEENFPHRISFAFLCKLMKNIDNITIFPRVITKGKIVNLTLTQKMTYMRETFSIVKQNFGLIAGLRYLVKPFPMSQNSLKPTI